MAAPVRRRKLIGHRRRVEDEGEDEGGPDQLDIDDDSLTDGSMASDDLDPADDSDTSNVDETSPTAPAVKKISARHSKSNGKPKSESRSATSSGAAKISKFNQDSLTDTQFMMNGLSISDKDATVQELVLEDATKSSTAKSSAPIVVSSNSVTGDIPPGDRRRREHDDYRRKRDEDPAFVPNRGAFFMHDHRHAGPSANGFRPFGRGPRGRGRGGIGGPFAPVNHQIHNPADPTVSAPWAHDMHDAVAQALPVRQPRPFIDNGPPNGDGIIPTCPPSSTPINRKMSSEKHIANMQIRVYIPYLKEPIVFSGVPVKQYTKLPDHRPPLRRDKPVRISLPDWPARLVFPAIDRSFIFIPRAMRPNQRLGGKPRSGLGSIGGFSRRTSVFGGSVYAGSAYSPSVALSRRSSIAPELGRDYLVSPTGSTMSRPGHSYDNTRPVVRLPPQSRTDQAFSATGNTPADVPESASQATINEMAQPQTHPLPQKPIFQENRATTIPMHQPRPQKTVSVAGIEAPELQDNMSLPYQGAFHQQVPVQVSNGLGHESHVRHPSYPSQHSTGTPLSQIPERAIHAAPFQPTHFSQNYYPPYQMMQPQQGYYYPPPPPPPYPSAIAPSADTPAFVPGAQQNQQPQGEIPTTSPGGQTQGSANLVAQEVNGMVYYYDASQLPPMTTYATYSTPQSYPMPNVGMNNNMVTPGPDSFYYSQAGPNVPFYPQ
ncbi:hypothetical protein F5Y15DRAFT_195560 [Xylariaceae sp. FL0016]|nr:hypothetical protein F5Y15DRAFT_195560 [Xylariaceae sp. FL0016]